ncbi:hypothetical protein [Ruegeria sp. Ofav3-42]|uniref:hypothetical protein n=1 Tax=Ruegeria sp. Ofav3-42 TaxID=2917759 RepID=UPI001EF736D0|nr:hypothetical protein [Ruegeria sp. Ofav3-42]MCG7522764.1 hypothetical protein [Ruegeria sp. Ofav3-42]
MRKVILWIIGIAIGVPALVVAFGAFMLFVFYPAKHALNVYRMDAKNERVWEEGTARVVTVEAELRTTSGIEELETDIICYQGHFARPWTLKNGAPRTGVTPTSVGFESLQVDFPTGATLDIDLYNLCVEAFRTETPKMPIKLEFSDMFVVAPELKLYCSFKLPNRLSEKFFQTDAAWVSYPRIVSIDERLLKSTTTISEMGSSEVPLIGSRFGRRWGLDFHRSNWSSEKQCWTGRIGQCDEEMNNYCGTNPR